ncbi:hypothetical protein LUZ60_010736 [Juncus effusus]|nr:hypothetical protein LUZ60_010736 [Juncus effusus]
MQPLEKTETSQKEEAPNSDQLLPMYTSTPILPPPSKKKKKGSCLCTCFIIIIVIIFLIIAAVLFGKFYLLKQRDLQIDSQDAYLVNLTYSIIPLSINLVVGMQLSIKNPNYAGFVYQNTDATVYYHGIQVGLATVPGSNIKARSTQTVNSTVYVDAGKMLASSYLLQEFLAGQLLISTTMKMTGKIIALKIFKLKATVYSSCDMTIQLATFQSVADCNSRINF